MKKRHLVLSLLCLSALLMIAGSSFVSRRAAPPARHQDLARGPVGAAWWSQVRAVIAAEEYQATEQDGVLQAPNRAQNLRTSFREEAIDVTPRTGDARWRMRWTTRAWGREGAMRVALATRPRTDEARVEYTRGELCEWYENRPEGVEQGFTLTSRPPGKGVLRVRGRIEAEGLSLKAAVDGSRLSLRDRSGSEVLRYAGLFVRDAAGRALPSRLEANGNDVDLLADDTAARYPITLDPLVSSPSWTAEGNLAQAQFGYSVATAGDVNRDGFSDLIVGAPGYDNGLPESPGRVFVFMGSASGPGAAAAWNAHPDFTGGDSQFGESVASAGDINGDGYHDIVVGAPLLRVGAGGGEAAEGEVFVWYGGPSGGAGGASGLGAAGTAGNSDWSAQSNQIQANLGRSVASAGDVNGDGFDDIIAGAPAYAEGEANEGKIFVWLGSATGLGVNGLPGNADWSAQSNFATALLGWSVAGVGDVNADGFDDVLAGAPGDNAALLWLGGAAGLGAAGTPLNADWGADGAQALAKFGASVAAAGDVNGDGYADVIIGAPLYDNPTQDEGKVFVWFGGPADLGVGGTPANADWSYEGGVALARFGASVATAGDIEGDGFADVVVGAPGYNGGLANEGLAMAFHGSGSGPGALPMWFYVGTEGNAELGCSVATAGDINGDGFSDIVVGAFTHDGDLVNEGEALVFTGSAYGPEGIASWMSEKNVAEAHYGAQVASAGDVNADGYSDVLVAAPDYDGGHAQEGRVYLYVGQPIGLAVNHSWSAEGNQTDAFFGSSVSSAGDIDNDGFDDVLIGAEGYDSGGLLDNGAAFLWRGSATGLGASGTPANADWRCDGTVDGEFMGSALAAAGDVNGDGFCDVALGAYGWDNGQIDEGHVLVYHGGTLGLANTAAWSMERNVAQMRFGYSVANAGDVNADGYSDLIVGASMYSGSHAFEGRAYVIEGGPTGLSASTSWIGDPNQDFAYYGTSVSSAGDVNGDGYSDILVGAYGYDGDLLEEGRVFVYHGSAAGVAVAPAWTAESNQSDSRFGARVSSAGDVNGDGYGDVLIGAYSYVTAAVASGRAFVWLGGPAGLGSNGTPTNADWYDYGAQLGTQNFQFGNAVACAGDVDGDGFSDIIVGAPMADDPEANEGAAFLFYGNSGHGMDRAVMQRRHDDAGRVAPLCFSSSETGFRVRSLARSAGGRARTRLEYEFRTLGGPFTPGNSGRSSNWADTGAPGTRGSVVALNAAVNFSVNGLVMRWRARVATDSPLFPHGPWLSIPGNGRTEGDIRLLHGVLASEPATPKTAGLRVLGAQPSRGAVTLAFELSAPGLRSLEIFDVGGRRVRQLAHAASFGAGHHELTWDGHTEDGSTAPAGCYFARLAGGSAGPASTVRITRVR